MLTKHATDLSMKQRTEVQHVNKINYICLPTTKSHT